jgi:hypothetical protein
MVILTLIWLGIARQQFSHPTNRDKLEWTWIGGPKQTNHLGAFDALLCSILKKPFSRTTPR